jgi:ribosome maturation protein SDO1
MSRQINQPVQSIKLTNVAVVRATVRGRRFEIACYKNKVLDYRAGLEPDISEVLQTSTVHVFTNVSRGEFASNADLVAAFDGTDQDAIALHVLKHGKSVVQVSDGERSHLYESTLNQIVTWISERCMNPNTSRPYTTAQIKQALLLSSNSSNNTNQDAAADEGEDAQLRQQQQTAITTTSTMNQNMKKAKKKKQGKAKAKKSNRRGDADEDGDAAAAGSDQCLVFTVQPNKPIKQQYLHALRYLQTILPIQRAAMELQWRVEEEDCTAPTEAAVAVNSSTSSAAGADAKKNPDAAADTDAEDDPNDVLRDSSGEESSSTKDATKIHAAAHMAVIQNALAKWNITPIITATPSDDGDDNDNNNPEDTTKTTTTTFTFLVDPSLYRPLQEIAVQTGTNLEIVRNQVFHVVTPATTTTTMTSSSNLQQPSQQHGAAVVTTNNDDGRMTETVDDEAGDGQQDDDVYDGEEDHAPMTRKGQRKAKKRQQKKQQQLTPTTAAATVVEPNTTTTTTATTATTEAATAAGTNHGDATAAPVLKCNTCTDSTFATQGEYRAHFRSDWHRFNQKLKLQHRSPVSLAEFRLCDAESFFATELENK